MDFLRGKVLLTFNYQLSMNKKSFILFLIFLFLVIKSFSQDFQITQPKLDYDGNQLSILYDLITRKSSDKFYVRIEIENANGLAIQAKTLSGDVGENVTPGNNKKIVWIPEQDSVYLNEDVIVEIKAEKYIKSFNKGSMMLYSTVFPGWGQTKISKGKPF